MSISLLLSIVFTILHITSHVLDVEARDVRLPHRHLDDTRPPPVVVGLCYGRQGDNLPTPWTVTRLYSQYNLNKMRIYHADPDVLNALNGTGIEVIVGTTNSDVELLANSTADAQTWFLEHFRPYFGTVNVTYISVGDEGQSIPILIILAAMRNLQSAVDSAGMHDSIKVTTVVGMRALQNVNPPSNAMFVDPTMATIVGFLKGSKLLVNVYPYLAYAENPKEIRMDYAQFMAKDVVVQDGVFGYKNLFDAMVDSFYWAMEKVGASDVGLVVSETGWPRGGGVGTSVDLASIYNMGLVKHLKSGRGTPKWPNVYLEAFINAMFDENKKPLGIETNWGVFQPTGEPNYIPFYP